MRASRSASRSRPGLGRAGDLLDLPLDDRAPVHFVEVEALQDPDSAFPTVERHADHERSTRRQRHMDSLRPLRVLIGQRWIDEIDVVGAGVDEVEAESRPRAR